MPEPFVVRPRAESARVEPSRAELSSAAQHTASPPRPERIAPAPAAPAAPAPPAAPADERPRGAFVVSVAGEPPGRTRGEPVRRPAALAPFAGVLDDPDVTDVFVNGARGLFVDRGRGTEPVAGWSATEEEVRDLAVALIALGDRHIDDAHPCVDVRIDGGLRVHAVLPPVSAGGTAISIRVPRDGLATLGRLEERGMYGSPVRAALEGVVARRENVLVTGPAGAGKTTLLAALLSAAPAHERIITIEDVAELRLDHPHHVRLEARQANLEGAGAIGLARLVREALRMRPDRLVVGECRGDEVRELLSALNTGHDGGAGTLHANGLADVPARLESLGALAGLDERSIARQTASAIDVVLHVDRDAGGRRILRAMGRPCLGADGRLAIEELPCAV